MFEEYMKYYKEALANAMDIVRNSTIDFTDTKATMQLARLLGINIKYEEDENLIEPVIDQVEIRVNKNRCITIDRYTRYTHVCWLAKENGKYVHVEERDIGKPYASVAIAACLNWPEVLDHDNQDDCWVISDGSWFYVVENMPKDSFDVLPIERNLVDDLHAIIILREIFNRVVEEAMNPNYMEEMPYVPLHLYSQYVKATPKKLKIKWSYAYVNKLSRSRRGSA